MIVENQPLPSNAGAGAVSEMFGITIHWDVIMPFIIIGIIITVFITIIWWIITKIVKKIQEAKRKKEDIEFLKYSIDLKNAQMNKNPNYKYKAWWAMGLLYTRAKIYARTSDGRKFVGYYDGEVVKKEGFFVMAIQLKHSFFKRETDLVIFPYELKRELVEFNHDGTIDLNCEGIDETLSSELFSIPVFKNTSDIEKKQLFSDYSNGVMENYFRKFSHQKVMKDLTIDYTNNVREATEINASIPYTRKTNSNLRE